MQDERSKLGGKITISSVHTQFAGLRAAGRVCTNTSGDAGMKKASTRLLEQETQTPSPAPDLIPLNHQLRTYIGIGTANGGTSHPFLLLVIAVWVHLWFRGSVLANSSPDLVS